MTEIPLHEQYRICGKTFQITRKTGRFARKRSNGNYVFVGDDHYNEQEFGIEAGPNLEDEIGLELNHRVSMVLFANRGYFLLYNHVTSRFKYFPSSINDLFYSLDRGFLKDILNDRKLKKESEQFDKSTTFLTVLDRVRRL